MKAKLIGLVEKAGIFENKPFHSIKFHIIAPGDEQGFVGWRVLDLKNTSIKYDRLAFIVGRPMEVSELATYVGSEIDVQYDDKQRISAIHFYADDYEPAAPKEKK